MTPDDHPGWSGVDGASIGLEAISSINCCARASAVLLFPRTSLCWYDAASIDAIPTTAMASTTDAIIASATARENTLKDELRYLRTQIVVYKAQHHDIPPGYPNGDRTVSATGPDFVAQMTKPTDEYCVTNPSATAVFKFGPYLSAMPR